MIDSSLSRPPHRKPRPRTGNFVVQPLLDGDIARGEGGGDRQGDPEVQGQGVELAAAPAGILGAGDDVIRDPAPLRG